MSRRMVVMLLSIMAVLVLGLAATASSRNRPVTAAQPKYKLLWVKIATPEAVAPGQQNTFEIGVTNNRNIGLAPVKVVAHLPWTMTSHVSLMQSKGSTVSIHGAYVQWTFSRIPPRLGYTAYLTTTVVKKMLPRVHGPLRIRVVVTAGKPSRIYTFSQPILVGKPASSGV